MWQRKGMKRAHSAREFGFHRDKRSHVRLDSDSDI